jgi:hypothetical protein
MARLRGHWGLIGAVWASLGGPVLGATPAELDRLGLALCQSLGPLLIHAAAGRDSGVSEEAAQAALARIPPADPDTRQWAILSIQRVYRDRRPGPTIAAEVIPQCIAVLPHRR